MKDAVEIASHVAEVIIAAIAVLPFLKKGLYVLTHAPHRSLDQIKQDFVLMVADGRMGPIQRNWIEFLRWCRETDKERITWREWWNRRLWCPLEGHRFGKQFKVGKEEIGARCTSCWSVFIADSVEALAKLEGQGRQPSAAMKIRYRKRKFSNALLRSLPGRREEY